MNIHVLHFLRKNRSSLICIFLALVLFICFIGPLWSYHSAQTKEYGEQIYTLTGQPVYANFTKIADKSITGDYRDIIICSFLCCFFALAIIALSIACLVIFGRTEYILKILVSCLFFATTIASMVMMIIIGGEIHQLEHPAVGEGVYGFLVGPGPICAFVFSTVAGVLNSTLLFLRKDGYSLKTMLHIQYKESKHIEDIETKEEQAEEITY